MDTGLFVQGNPTIREVSIPPLIVGNAAYPLKKWLMKPFRSKADRRRVVFDMRLSSARNVVECAFGRLKARGRCLSARLPVSIKNVISVISACLILHNICEEKSHGTVVSPAEAQCLELEQPAPHTARSDAQNLQEGEIVRNALADFFMEGEL